MDPNAALRTIREIAAADLRPWKARGHWDEVEALVEHVRALDEWLSKGGFLPEAWAPDPPRDVQAAPSVGTGPYEAPKDLDELFASDTQGLLSNDPYCAQHGTRFDPEVGCPGCLAEL